MSKVRLAEATLNWFDQERKMDAWHNGTRGAAVSAMSDAKLRMNYDICTQNGYSYEANVLKTEAANRGLSWAQPKPQPAVQPQPAQQPQVQNKQLMSFTADEFTKIDATFVKDNENNSHGLIASAMLLNGTIRWVFKYLIHAIVLKCPQVKHACLQFLTGNAGMSIDEIKNTISNVLANQAIVDKLNELVALVSSNTLTDNLHEDIEKHTELNPKLWNEDNTLKDEVKEKINEIVKDFTDGLDEKEIKYKLDDIKLVGSNCSYNYNKNSDLDLHIVFDLNIYDDDEKQEMAEIIYDYARSAWNKNHDIYFYDIPVEIFVETNNTEQLN